MFYKNGHNSGPSGSPDMILTAFDVKFQEKKNENKQIRKKSILESWYTQIRISPN